MKKAGDVLSAILGDGFAKKAQGYSKFFDSWKDITAKNGMANAAVYSRIKELEKGIVTIEMDHPGWKQLLQTKQSKLLNDFRIRFPELNIMGISLMLGSGEVSTEEKSVSIVELPEITKSSPVISAPLCEEFPNSASDIEAIKDDDLKEKLIKLGQTIAEREKGA